MIIDMHAHIFPDAIAEKAAKNIAAFYGLDMDGDGRLSKLLEESRAAGIDKVLVCSAATTPHQTAPINDFIAESVAAHPGILYGLGAMHQDTADMPREVARIRDMHLKGVKIHPDIQKVPVNDPRFDPLYEALSDQGMILLAHAGDARYQNSNPPELLDVLTRFPRLTIIGAHFGCWSNWIEGAKHLIDRENFRVDCSSSLYALSVGDARGLIRAYGADRVLFGSDYPMWSQAIELKRLTSLGLTADEMDLITHKNAQRLLGIA